MFPRVIDGLEDYCLFRGYSEYSLDSSLLELLHFAMGSRN